MAYQYIFWKEKNTTDKNKRRYCHYWGSICNTCIWQKETIKNIERIPTKQQEKRNIQVEK